MLLTASELVGTVARFVRNVLIVRLITQADFGIGTTFAVTVTFLEMISNLGFERLILQAKDGDDERLVNTAHLMVLLRGVMIGAVMFLLAPAFAWWWQMPEHAWVFRVLAAVPVIRCMVHLDVWRVQRQMNYLPWAMYKSAPFVVTTAAVMVAFVLYKWYGVALWPWMLDFRVLLVMPILDVVMQAAITHLFAKRAFRFRWDGATVMRFVLFGWPLLISGALLWAMTEGERAVVGRWYDKPDLALYTIAFQLVMMPVMIVTQVHDRLVFPLMARAQDDAALFRRRYRYSAQTVGLLGGWFVIGFMIAGAWLTPLIYGPTYAPAGVFIGWIAVAQAMHLVRETPVKASTARGDTLNVMVSNVIRTGSLAAAVAVAIQGGELWMIAATGVGGEAAAYLAASWRAWRRHGVPLTDGWAPACVMLAAAGAALAVVRSGMLDWRPWMPPAVAGMMLAVYSALVVACFSEMRGEAAQLLRRRRGEQPDVVATPGGVNNVRKHA